MLRRSYQRLIFGTRIKQKCHSKAERAGFAPPTDSGKRTVTSPTANSNRGTITIIGEYAISECSLCVNRQSGYTVGSRSAHKRAYNPAVHHRTARGYLVVTTAVPGLWAVGTHIHLV